MKQYIYILLILIGGSMSAMALPITDEALLSYQTDDYGGAMQAYTLRIERIENRQKKQMKIFKKCTKDAHGDPDIPCFFPATDPNLAVNYYSRGIARKYWGDHSGSMEDFNKAAALFLATGNMQGYQLVLNLLSRFK